MTVILGVVWIRIPILAFYRTRQPCIQNDVDVLSRLLASPNYDLAAPFNVAYKTKIVVPFDYSAFIKRCEYEDIPVYGVSPFCVKTGREIDSLALLV